MTSEADVSLTQVIRQRSLVQRQDRCIRANLPDHRGPRMNVHLSHLSTAGVKATFLDLKSIGQEKRHCLRQQRHLISLRGEFDAVACAATSLSRSTEAAPYCSRL